MGTPFLSPSLLSAMSAEKLGDRPDCPHYSWVSRSCSGSWKVKLSCGTFQEQPQPTGLAWLQAAASPSVQPPGLPPG